MNIGFTERVVISDDVLVTIVKGEAVLLSLASEKYYGLDEIGTSMWEALTTNPSIQAAYEVLLRAYDVEEEQLRVDLQGLVEKLQKQGLVVLVPEKQVDTVE